MWWWYICEDENEATAKTNIHTSELNNSNNQKTKQMNEWTCRKKYIQHQCLFLAVCIYHKHTKKCTHKIHYKVFYTISPTVLYIHQMYWQCTDRKVPASHLFFTIFVTHKHTHTHWRAGPNNDGWTGLPLLLCLPLFVSRYHMLWHIPHTA